MDNSDPRNKHPEIETLGLLYENGEVIFREGDMTNSLYIIQAGHVRLTKTLKSGREVEVAVLGPGEALGIASLADDKMVPRYASAIASGKTSVLEIDRARFIRAVYDDPTLIFTIFKAMSWRARNLTDRLAACESKHDEENE